MAVMDIICAVFLLLSLFNLCLDSPGLCLAAKRYSTDPNQS